MGRVFASLDTGTHASLLDAGNSVRTRNTPQGLQIGSLDEVAYQSGWIDRDMLLERAARFAKNSYGAYLLNLARG